MDGAIYSKALSVESPYIMSPMAIIGPDILNDSLYGVCMEVGISWEDNKSHGPREYVLFYIEDLLHAFKAFAEQGLVHGDCKQNNVILTDLGNFIFTAMLNDLDLVREEGSDLLPYKDSDCRIPPEIDRTQMTHKMDMWALGMMIYHLLVEDKRYWITKRDAQERGCITTSLPDGRQQQSWMCIYQAVKRLSQGELNKYLQEVYESSCARLAVGFSRFKAEMIYIGRESLRREGFFSEFDSNVINWYQRGVEICKARAPTPDHETCMGKFHELYKGEASPMIRRMGENACVLMVKYIEIETRRLQFILDGLLKVDPARRLTAAEILHLGFGAEEKITGLPYRPHMESSTTRDPFDVKGLGVLDRYASTIQEYVRPWLSRLAEKKALSTASSSSTS